MMNLQKKMLIILYGVLLLFSCIVFRGKIFQAHNLSIDKDDYMSVTFPTQILFGTYDNTGEIQSEKYEIINNSPSIKTSIVLDSFDKIRSEVVLLGEKDEKPEEESESAKVNMLVNNNLVVEGLNESSKDIDITRLEPNEKVNLEIDGKYYGNIKEKTFVDYNMNFKIRAAPVNVTPKKQIAMLGENFSNRSPYDMIIDVVFDGKVLDRDEYTVELTEPAITSIVGESTAKITVVPKGYPQNIEYVDVPVEVQWGSTIVTNRDDYNSSNNNRVDSSISLLPGVEHPIINANQGNGFLEGVNAINSRPSFSIFRNNINTEIFFLDYNNIDQTPENLMNQWNNSLSLTSDIRYGDVIAYKALSGQNEIQNSQGNNTWISRNNTLTRETIGYDVAYYEITDSGYRLMQGNQMEVKNGVVVNTGTGKNEMNSNILNFISIPPHIKNPGYYHMEFKDVDTQTAGHKTSEIYVYEKLEGNKEFRFSYFVDYIVGLTVVANEQVINLSEDLSKRDPYDFIKEVELNGEIISKDEYTVSLDSNISTDVTGQKIAKAKVSLKDTSQGYTIVDVPVNVEWGSTIVSKHGSTGVIDSSVSLLNFEGKPILNANHGNAVTTGNLGSRPSINVYRNSLDEVIVKGGVLGGNNTVYQPATQLLDRWNDIFQRSPDLMYGDVMEYKVFSSSDPSKNLKGENTWISRNNTLTREAIGYDNAYYELTTDGYRLMQGNQLTVKNNNYVAVDSSKEELDKNISDFITIPSHIKNPENYRLEFKGVDTETSGHKTSDIYVYERLQNGKEFVFTYPVSYIVGLTASPNQQTLVLGEDLSNYDTYKLVKDVKVEGKPLGRDEYTVSFNNTVQTDITGSKIAKMKVTALASPKNNTIIDVPVEVQWGNTIVSKRKINGVVDSSVSLLNFEGKPMLNANQGNGFGTGNLGSRPSINVYRNSLDEVIVEGGVLGGNNTVYQSSEQLLDRWNGIFQRSPDLMYGDVMEYKVFSSSDPSKNSKGGNTWISRNNTLTREAIGYDDAYYELATDGYRLLQGNQLTVKNNNHVKINTTKEELDKNISDFITIPPHIENPENYRLEFKDVDTETFGYKTSDMYVYEKLQNGKEFVFVYPVSYIINELSATPTAQTVILGEDLSKRDPYDFVEEVKLDDEIISKDEYIVSLYSNISTDVTGQKIAKAKVSLKDTSQGYTIVDVPVNVEWGSTIVSKHGSTGVIDSSVSLLNFEGKPILNANHGNAVTTGNLGSRPSINVYRNSLDEVIVKGGVLGGNNTVYQPATQLLDRWNDIFQRSPDLMYGDVMEYKVFSSSDPSKNLKGENTWISRNNTLTREAIGYDNAYYELTTDGYRLMQGNQLTVKNNNYVAVDSSKEELDKNISDFITIPSHIKNPENYRLEFKGVDTETSGHKTSDIYVYERLQNGKEFVFTYPVSYIVGLTASPNQQTLVLGEDLSSYDTYKLVKDVKVEGKPLGRDEYTVSFNNTVQTDITGSKIAKMKVTALASPRNNTIIDVPVEVEWGSTIVSTYNNTGAIDSSVSLLNFEGKPMLNANQGSGIGTGSLGSLPSINVYRNNLDNVIVNGGITAGNDTDYQTPTQLLDRWNGIFQRSPDLMYGDVMAYSVFAKDNPIENLKGENTWVSRNNTLTREAMGYDNAYYELTTDGYKLLQGNQLTVENNNYAVVNATKEEMDKNISNFITIPPHIENPENYRLEFKDVDTETSGYKTSDMYVYEKLQNGEEFMFIYPIEYTVVSFSANPISQVVSLGEDLSDRNLYDVVDSVTLNNKVLDESEYEVSLENMPRTDIVGDSVATVRVSQKNMPKNYIIVDVPVDVEWGSTIVSKYNSTGAIDSSVSLLNFEGKPILHANQGSGIGTGNLGSLPSINVYRNNLDNIIVNGGITAGNDTDYQTPAQLLDRWNGIFQRSPDLMYGDVMAYSVFAKDNPIENLMGENTWISRSNTLTREVTGHDNAYYELTTDGYRLMQGNQLELSYYNQVPLNTSKEELDQNISEFITFPPHIDNKDDYRMEFESVDTETVGYKNSTIYVYEKLLNGSEFRHSYYVSFYVISN